MITGMVKTTFKEQFDLPFKVQNRARVDKETKTRSQTKQLFLSTIKRLLTRNNRDIIPANAQIISNWKSFFFSMFESSAQNFSDNILNNEFINNVKL